MTTCAKCERTQNLSPCTACGAFICPSHRCGLGSVSDGYTCLNHVGFGYAVSALQLREQKEAKRVAPPRQWWLILAIVIVVLIVLPYFMQVSP